MKDIFKVIAYFNVYGLDIYGTKHHGYDTGKNNLVSYFCDKLGWSESRLKKIVSRLKQAGVIERKPAEAGFSFYRMSSLYKSFLLIL